MSMPTPPSPREVEELIQRALDSSLEEPDADQLRRILHEHPNTLDLYCSYSILESELHRYHDGNKNITARTGKSVPRYSSRRQLTASLAAAAAILVLAIIFLSLIWTKPPKPIITSFALSPHTVAMANSASPLEADQLELEQRITLVQGAVHLELQTGTEAVIEAPAVFTLRDLGHLHLESGRAWFHVPKEGRGFSVATPDARIVDLGTEFGVVTSEKSPTEVHVFQGKVAVYARNGVKGERSLSVGEAATTNWVGRWTKHSADPTAFKRTLPSNLPSVHFSFDTLVDNRVPVTNTITNGQQIRALVRQPENGPKSATLVPGVRGSALHLDGRGGYLTTDWPGIPGTGPLTVRLWVKIAPGTHVKNTAPALALWGDPTNTRNSKFKLALHGDGSGRPQPRISLGMWRANCTVPLDDGKWHHLALVYHKVDQRTGDPIMDFYLDGKREPLTTVVAATDLDTFIQTTSPKSFLFELGRYELSPKNPGFLRASFDELHVTAGALPGERILKIFQEEKERR